MTWLQPQKKRCYADFLKVPPSKNDGRNKPKFRPISRLTATPSLVMWKENKKTKTMLFISDY